MDESNGEEILQSVDAISARIYLVLLDVKISNSLPAEFPGQINLDVLNQGL